jgi:uncharacterized protein
VFLYSESTLNELIDVLGRSRMVRRYGLRAEEVDALCALVILRGELIHPTRTIEVCRDPKDDKFLEVAIAGQADVIVTSDEDLAILGPFEGISMVSAANFLRMIKLAP